MMEKRINAGKPVDDFIRIQDLWGIFVPKWYWFAISLFITLVCASLYLLSTPNIYTRTAAVLIKDDSKNCLLYTSPSPRDGLLSRMPSSA